MMQFKKQNDDTVGIKIQKFIKMVSDRDGHHAWYIDEELVFVEVITTRAKLTEA